MKGISNIWIAVILVVAIMASAGLVTWYSTTLRVVPAVEYAGYFDEVGRATLETPFSVQDFDISPVVFSDEDQTTAGVANLTVENGSTVSGDKYLYIYIKTRKKSKSLTLEMDMDDSGSFTEDTVSVKEATLKDYDSGDVVAEIDEGQLVDNGWKSSILDQGEYILEIIFKIAPTTASATEGATDKIAELSGELDSPDADSDKPTEFEDFLIQVVTE